MSRTWVSWPSLCESHADPAVVLALAFDPYRQATVAYERSETIGRAEALIALVGACPDVRVRRRGDLDWLVFLDSDTGLDDQPVSSYVRRPRVLARLGASTASLPVAAGVARDADLPGLPVDRLIRLADAALGEAIGAHHSTVFADVQTLERVAAAVTVASRLAAAGEDEFVVHHQPIVELGDRRIVGFESLMRWSTDDGLRMPADFLEVAEQTSMIVPIGRHTTERAIADLAEIIIPRYGDDAFVTINMSIQELVAEGNDPHLAGVLRRHGVNPANVWIELGETQVITADGQTAAVIGDLHDLGCTICVDDLGAGFSALRYVFDLPVDVLKVDRSLISALGAGGTANAVVRAICGIARGVGATLVAEGIENEETLTRVDALGFDLGQGYLLGRPAPLTGATG